MLPTVPLFSEFVWSLFGADCWWRPSWNPSAIRQAPVSNMANWKIPWKSPHEMEVWDGFDCIFRLFVASHGGISVVVEVSGRLYDDQGPCSVHRCGVHQKGPCGCWVAIVALGDSKGLLTHPCFPFNWPWRNILFFWAKPGVTQWNPWQTRKNGMQSHDLWLFMTHCRYGYRMIMRCTQKSGTCRLLKSAPDLDIHPTW